MVCEAYARPMQPRYIQVHPTDNVAIVVNDGGLPAGTQFDSGLTLLEAIPEAHKVALTAIPAGCARTSLRHGHRPRETDIACRLLGPRSASSPSPSFRRSTSCRRLCRRSHPNRSRLHLRGLRQRRRLRRHQEHPRHQHHRPVRRRDRRLRREENQSRTPPQISQRRRRHRDHPQLRLRHRHRRPRLRDPHPHAAQPQPQPQPRRSADGRQPGLRKDAARAHVAQQHAADSLRTTLHCPPAGRPAPQLRRHGRRHHGDGRRPPQQLNLRRRQTCPASEPRRRPAMRRQRRLLRSHRQSRRRLRRRSAGPRRRHRHVLRSHGSPRRHPSADGPRRHRRKSPTA